MNGTYEIQDFETDVIERSRQLPVVVDFWAEWCGPCKVLGPVLEKLAAEDAGRWALAKVNTEVFQEEARRYGIYSIPNVKMFFSGEVIGEFVGALPDYSVRQWLESVLPGRHVQRIEEAAELLESGDEAGARDIIEAILAEDPDDKEARVLLAGILLFDDHGKAAELVRGIDEPKLSEQIETVTTISRLFDISDHAERLEESPTKETYQSAIAALRRKDFAGALEGFIGIIRSDRFYDEDGSRKACIAIFRLLGDEHPVTASYRREFTGALY